MWYNKDNGVTRRKARKRKPAALNAAGCPTSKKLCAPGKVRVTLGVTMIIIAQAGAVVNINAAQEKATVHDWSKYNAAVEEIGETRTAKWASHKAESARVAEKMKKIDTKRGYRMAQCADTLVYNVCPDCGHTL